MNASELDQPLQSLPLPARMLSYAARQSLTTVRELIAVPPEALLLERNLGKKTIADTDAALQARFGVGWDDLRGEFVADSGGVAQGSQAERWRRICERASDDVRALAVTRTPDLPTRLRTFAATRNVTTTGQLLSLDWNELAASRNLGRKSLGDTLAAFERLLANPPTPAEPEVDPLRIHDRWMPLFRELVASLAREDRLIMTQRAGLSGPPPTLAELGLMLGVSRERVRQREARGIERLRARSVWSERVGARLHAALAGALFVPLAELGARDAFLRCDEDEDDAFAFFVAEILGGSFRVFRVNQVRVLSRIESHDLERRVGEARRAAESLPLPTPYEGIHERLAAMLGVAVEDVAAIAALLERDWLVQDGFVEALESKRGDAIVAFVRGERGPVTRDAIEVRFGRFHMPDALVYLARGLVTSADHIPDWERWRARLGPECERLIAENGPERQWLTRELVPLLAENADLPPWLNEWTLGSALRNVTGVRYLGRNAVALEDAGQDRRYILETAVDLLERRGTPAVERELVEEVRALRGVTPLGWALTRIRRPLLLLQDEHIGLTPRDVPGGSDAVGQFVDAAYDWLDQRQTGIGGVELAELLSGLSADTARWDNRMARSVLRHDGRFRLAQGGALGLLEWEDVRVPTQGEVLARLLDAGGGRVEVDAARAAIPTTSGLPLSRGRLGLLANSIGAGLAGTHIVREPPTPSTRPSDALEQLIAELPERAAPVYRRLLVEPTTVSSVQSELDTWRSWILEEAKTNPYVELAQIDELVKLATELLDRCDPATDRGRARLAAVRYLACVDDGESDAALGGLDDDEAVLRTVASVGDSTNAS